MLADPFQTTRPSGWVKCVGGCGGDGGNGGFHKDSVRPAASTNMECPTSGHLFPHLLNHKIHQNNLWTNSSLVMMPRTFLCPTNPCHQRYGSVILHKETSVQNLVWFSIQRGGKICLPRFILFWNSSSCRCLGKHQDYNTKRSAISSCQPLNIPRGGAVIQIRPHSSTWWKYVCLTSQLFLFPQLASSWERPSRYKAHQHPAHAQIHFCKDNYENGDYDWGSTAEFDLWVLRPIGHHYGFFFPVREWQWLWGGFLIELNIFDDGVAPAKWEFNMVNIIKIFAIVLLLMTMIIMVIITTVENAMAFLISTFHTDTGCWFADLRPWSQAIVKRYF